MSRAFLSPIVSLTLSVCWPHPSGTSRTSWLWRRGITRWGHTQKANHTMTIGGGQLNPVQSRHKCKARDTLLFPAWNFFFLMAGWLTCYSFFRLLDDSGTTEAACAKLKLQSAQQQLMWTKLVRFSSLEHSFQNSTHLSHGFNHNVHNTVDSQHFVQILTHCCQNCKHTFKTEWNSAWCISNTADCNFSWNPKQVCCLRLVTEHIYISRAHKDLFWKWNKEDGLVEGEKWQGEGCVEEDKQDKDLLFQMK